MTAPLHTENIKLKHEVEIQKLAYEKIEREKDFLALEYELSQVTILKLKNNNSTNQTELARLSRELSEQKQRLATSHFIPPYFPSPFPASGQYPAVPPPMLDAHLEVEKLQEALRRNEHELAAEKFDNAMLRKQLSQGQEIRNTMPQNSDEDYNGRDECKMTSYQQKYNDASGLNTRLETIEKRLAICESQLTDGRKGLVHGNEFLAGTDQQSVLQTPSDLWSINHGLDNRQIHEMAAPNKTDSSGKNAGRLNVQAPQHRCTTAPAPKPNDVEQKRFDEMERARKARQFSHFPTFFPAGPISVIRNFS